jgi:16S rRNA (cytosine967-C5)-methyltransferase
VTPSARLQAAVEILEGLAGSALPADRFIRDWFRTRRYAGSKDRASVAERVFAVYRHRASLAWRMRSDAPRALVIASLLCEGGDVGALFDGSGYGPGALHADEHAAIASPPTDAPPLAVRCEFPSFLEAELGRSLGTALADEMAAMLARAPVDLRVNTLKAKRDGVRDILQRDGFDAMPTPWSPVGLRIAPRDGLAALHRHAAFEAGLYEFQDEAAQVASLLAQARPGERVLDLAAGAGGKALALAAAMNNAGAIVASDIGQGRLLQIAARAARAGATIIRLAEAPPQEQFDLVFVDAPCSGSGTWRRQPEQKWRLAPERLADLTAIQDALLDEGGARVRPGGRLVYATCSLLMLENEDRVHGFLARHPDFTLARAVDGWDGPAPPGLAEFFRATPHRTGTDGFFAAICVRKRAADSRPPCGQVEIA